VDSLNQRRNMLWGRELADAMAQIENMRGSYAGGIGVRFAKTVQHPNHFFLNLRRWRKQHIGVNVALQGFAWAIHCAPHHLAGTSQVHGPVQTQHVAIELAHLFKPQAAAFGENKAGNAHAQVLFLQQRQNFGGVGQAELFERRIGQHAPQLSKIMTACAPASIWVLR